MRDWVRAINNVYIAKKTEPTVSGRQVELVCTVLQNNLVQYFRNNNGRLALTSGWSGATP